MNKIVGGLILLGMCLVVILGCPLLPVDIFDDPADPGSENYHGYPLIDNPDEIEGCIDDGAYLITPRFVVSQVQDAQAYRLQVATDAEFASVVYDEDGFARNVMDADDLEGFLTKSLDERYWRACAKAGDTWGAWSEARSFVYMHPNTVYFDAQGGTEPNPEWKAVVVGQTYGVLPVVRKSGYVFDGWWTGEGKTGTQVTASTLVDIAEGHKLNASWQDGSILMTYVQGGTFLMGSTNGDSDERPVHSVTVDNFYIGTYEVTQDLYEQVMGSNPSYWKGASLPVEKVTWYEAVAFCNALSRREGFEEVYTINGTSISCDWTKIGYRLPTEAEWEYAARGGDKSKGYTYAGSNSAGDVAWYNGNSGNRTHVVGGKLANELNLYDMSGNVWEWCWDWYGNNYYSVSPSLNPTGPSSGMYRVLRGGCWYYHSWYLRSVFRRTGDPSPHDYVIGFRLLRPKK